MFKIQRILIIFLIFSFAFSSLLDSSNSTSHSENNNSPQKYKTINRNESFWYSLSSGFSLIFISEIGDRTFIMAIFYTIKVGILPTFLVASTTLVLLNFISLMIGMYLPLLIYKFYLDICATLLFLFFGVSLLYNGIRMENKKIIEELNEYEEEEEMKERQNEKLLQKDEENDGLQKNDKEESHNQVKETDDGKDVVNLSFKKKKENIGMTLLSFSFTMILTEIGDRSQITAIAIAAVYEFYGVLIGSSLGHVVATLIAVTIGHYFAEHVSEKMITIVGGVLFLLFSIDSFINLMMNYY